ncbi:MAG TPA: ATP-binding protein, partial [Kofleriaceae bacterium]
NAVKYTPKGGHVAVRVAAQNAQALIEVRDDGIGMDATTLTSVFDTFVQGKQGLDRSRGGLGLGLTVVRSLVELHGGTISARSDGEGKGSTFTVLLPLAHPTEKRTPTPPRVTTIGPSIDQLRVLIVEDNEDAREALAELLRVSVGEVMTEDNGKAGLERALAVRPDVMLVDIGLPILDGYEVARQMRKYADGHRPRMIAMTGYGQPEDRQRALASGFDSHLVKPIAYAQLLAQLATAAKISSDL